jgi:hypothetical protein
MVFAEEPQASGFHGDITLGGLWSSSDNQLIPGDDNKKISSLSGNGETETDVFAMAMGNLSYTTQAGTRFFISADRSFSTGVSHDFAGIANVTLAGVAQLGEVWEDPYLIGVEREDTDETRIGGRLGLEGIYGTGLSFDYSYMNVEVDNDLIGTKIALLRRDGLTHTLSTGYAFQLGESNSLTPKIQYEIGDFDGKSSSYDSWGGSLTHTFNNEVMMLETTVSAGKSEYDQSHPIFNTIRDDETYAVCSTITWFNPLGYENFSVTATGAYSKSDSNIDFYDSTDTMVGVGIGYRF